MAKKIEREYIQAANQHRQRLATLVESHSVNRLKSLYDSAQDELESKLRKTPGRKDQFSAYQHQALLVQVRQGQAVIAQKMAGESIDLSRETQVESLRGLTKTIGKLEKIHTGAAPVLPIEEASRFWGVIDKRRTSLIRAHKTSMASFGSRVVASIEETLGLSLATGGTLDETISKIRKTANNEWWQAERIVRTEQAWAFNSVAVDGIAEIDDEIGGMYSRWVEHVDDNGNPLDDRVGADSIAMHGQIVKPGGMFEMPEDADVDELMWGKRWSHPPSRPNDRAVLSPWRSGWGGLAWELQGSKKVYK